MNLDPNMLLLAQYLGAAGQDISSGKPIGANVNQVTQQAIQNIAFKQMMKELMGGNIPGATAKISDKGISLDLPKESGLLKSMLEDLEVQKKHDLSIPTLGGGSAESTPFLGNYNWKF